MNELERALREAEVPDAVAARERARQTVLAAHRPVRRRPRLALVWVAVACGLAAVVFSARDTGPARALEQRVRNVFTAPAPAPTPSPTTLSGRLLVLDAAPVVRPARRQADRARRVARRDLVTARALRRRRGGQHARRDRARRRDGALAAPAAGAGAVSRAGRPAGCTSPTAPAATCGSSTATAGTTCSRAATWPRSPPAWRPNEPRTVAWAAQGRHGHGRGRRHREGAVDIGPGAGPPPRVVGRRPAAARRRRAQRDDPRLLRRRARATRRAGRGSSPWRSRARLALAAYDRGRTTVTIDGQTVLTAPGRLRDLEWSPDGRRLLAGWPGADHWLVVRGDEVAAVRHRFAPGRPHARVGATR